MRFCTLLFLLDVHSTMTPIRLGHTNVDIINEGKKKNGKLYRSEVLKPFRFGPTHCVKLV